MLFRKAWLLRSAALLCGAGSAAMPSAPGNIEAGSSLVIRTLPPKPVPSLLCTNVSGKAHRWALMITSSAPTKRPVFKPAAENNRRCRWRPIAHCSRKLIAADRARALGLRAHGSNRPLDAIKASQSAWISSSTSAGSDTVRLTSSRKSAVYRFRNRWISVLTAPVVTSSRFATSS